MRSILPTLAFAFILMLALAPAGDARAQTRALDVDDAAGDSLVHINDDGGFAAYGESFTGSIPAEGEGERMMWYPAKAAFRAGTVGDQWDDANVGRYSVAFGNDTEASGPSSTAMGFFTTASGARSTAMGYQSTASGDESTAMGFGTEASGERSTAMGSGTTASAPRATAMGDETEASAPSATAMGDETEASGTASTAMGHRTHAATWNSVSIGMNNEANRGNDDDNPQSGPLFVVGNGTSVTSRSDALVLDQSGNLEISGSLDQNSDRRLKEGIQPLGAGVLEKLEQVRPVRYRFKNEATHPSGEQLGVIAQEVQEQFPQLVSEGASGYLSVSYPKFTAVLLKGLQEQQAEIERLEAKQAKVASLREENASIKKRLAKLEQERGGGPLTAGVPGGAWTLGGLLGLALVGGALLWRRRA